MSLKTGTRFRQESVVHGVSTRLGDGTLLRQRAIRNFSRNLADLKAILESTAHLKHTKVSKS
jgi:hypothetical protein